MSSDAKIEYDKKGILLKLAFLIDKTLVMNTSEGLEAVKVTSIRVAPGIDFLRIYTTNGVLNFRNVDWMKDTFLLTDNGLKSLKDVADELEVYF